MTRHRVYLPGPLGLALPAVPEHPDGCDPDRCPVLDAMAAWMAEDESHVWQVQGWYFTEDGGTFTRCDWQPPRP